MTVIERTLYGRRYEEICYGEDAPDTPIVLVLHFMTGDFASMRFVFDGYSKPIRAIFLQAPYYGGEQHSGWSWYPDGEKFYERPEAKQAPDILESADRIAPLLPMLRGMYPDTVKFAVMGMSQGGDLALALAAYYPHFLSLVIPFAGRLSPVMRPPQFKPAAVMPVVSMHIGSADPIVSVDSSREAAAWLVEKGFDAKLHEYAGVGHDISPAMVQNAQAALAAL